MKVPPAPHRWDVTPRQAAEIQRRLAGKVRCSSPAPRRILTVAGLDAAFSRDGSECLGAAVLWDVPGRRVLEIRVSRRRVRFPYVPGLLSFREAPALLAALAGLEHEPDALIFDGHGLAHPRRFGIACHVGVLLDLPAVGCAKSRLVGRHAEPSPRRGSRRRLVDDGETVGAVLRTRDGIRPVFVSAGHRVDLRTAVRLVLRCTTEYRLPEPTRLADRRVAAMRRDDQ